MCDTEPLKYHLLVNQIRTRKAGGARSQAGPSVNAKDFQGSEREKKKKLKSCRMQMWKQGKNRLKHTKTEGRQPDLIMSEPQTQWLGWNGDTLAALTQNKNMSPPASAPPHCSSFSLRLTGQPVGGFDWGLVTILRRADTESAARGQIGRCSAHRVQMRRSGSAGGERQRAEQTEPGRCERATLPHRGQNSQSHLFFFLFLVFYRTPKQYLTRSIGV